MKKYVRRNIFPLIIVILLVSGNGFTVLSQENAGIPFLKMNIGSHAEAMGGAYTAIAKGANAIYYNPAGLGLSANREMMLYHTQWFSNIAIENLTIVYPFNRQWSLGSSISFLHMPAFDRYEIDPLTGGPLAAGKFMAYDMVFTTGLGFRISDNIYLGSNLKFLQERLESVTANGIAADFGVLTNIPAFGIRLGLAVQNFGTRIKYIQAKSILPLTFRAGVAYQYHNGNNTIAFDIVSARGEPLQILPGIEVGISDNFSLRGGYQPTQQEKTGLSAGFGLKLLEGHQINYAYTPYGDLGDAHRAEFIINLGRVAAKPVSISGKTENNEKTLKAIGKINLVKNESSNLSNHHNEVTVQLVPPENLQILNSGNDKMKLTWQKVNVTNTQYNVYAKQISSDKWIKLTPTPIDREFQLFTLKRTGVQLMFVVTTVQNGIESKFSKSIVFKSP